MRTPNAAIAAVFAIACSALAATPLNTNLVVNGDAESGPGGAGGATVPVPGWTTTGAATAAPYGTSGGFPAPGDPGPASRGVNFFAGGPNNDSSSLSQLIDVSDIPAVPQMNYTFSGYLGGYSSQNDHTDATVAFLDSGGATLATAMLPGVSAADRGSATGLLARTISGAVPNGTAKLAVTLHFVRTEGSFNDGYADNISVVLTSTAPCIGDLNNDHVINTLDLAKLLSNFGNTVPAGTLGDLNGDGVVNTVDLAKLLSHFGEACP